MSSRAAFLSIGLVVCLACQPEKAQGPGGPNHPPTAKLGGPYSGVEGAELAFNAGGSTDPDGDTLRYAWDFGDGSTGTGAVAPHRYADNGVYAVRAIVTDPAGASDTAVVAATVANASPEIVYLTTPATAVAVGVQATVFLSFSDPGSADTLSSTLNWGDGTSSSSISGESAAHTYTAAGQYFVTLLVRDNDGAEVRRLATNAIIVFDPSNDRLSESSYETINLGTLEGNSARPVALNDVGQIVGSSTTASGETHAFLWENGVMRDLAVPFLHSTAETITNSGVIGGVGSTIRDVHVFRWINGSTTDLGTVWGSGEENVHVNAMTTSDVLATGRAQGNWSRAVLWENAARRELGTLTPLSPDWPYGSAAAAMNNRGQIVGASRMPIGSALYDIYHPFIWENGVMRDLGVFQEFPCPERPEFNCGHARATDVNNSAEVIGWSVDSEGRQHGVLWVNGSLRDLGFPSPVAINEAGDIAGNGIQATDGTGYFWRSGTLTTLGSLGGGGTNVVDMNDQSIVVGNSQTADGTPHVFVWKPGQTELVELGTGGPPETGAFAVAINARGDIIGYTCPEYNNDRCSGTVRAVLWRMK